jgi:NADPH2:quinone reductase
MARTAIIEKPGGPEQFRIVDRDVGEPGPGEIRIRHAACGLNFIDVYQRTGLYPLEMPHALGMEAAGVVEAVGEGVTHLKPGDRAAYAAAPPGAYTEARVMRAAQVCPLPDGISTEEGAAMMLKGLTTNYLFRRTTPIARGRHGAVSCGGGRCGPDGLPMGASEGIRLIGTAGTDDKCQLALDHGAEACINYRDKDWVARGEGPYGRQGRRRGDGRGGRRHVRGIAQFAQAARHDDLLRQRLRPGAALQHRHPGAEGFAQDHAADALHPYRGSRRTLASRWRESCSARSHRAR